MTVLKWAYVRYGIEVEEFESLIEAVTAAHYAAEDSSESLVCVEVVGEKIYLADDLFRCPRRATVRVDVRAPTIGASKGEWGGVDWLTSDDEAETARASWAARLGEDRVRITRLGTR